MITIEYREHYCVVKEGESVGSVPKELGEAIEKFVARHRQIQEVNKDLVKALRDMVVYEGMDYNDDRRIKAVERAKEALAKAGVKS